MSKTQKQLQSPSPEQTESMEDQVSSAFEVVDDGDGAYQSDDEDARMFPARGESRVFFANSAAKRLDVWLAEQLAISRNQVQKLIASQCVLCDSQPATSRQSVRVGQCITVQMPELEEYHVVAEDIPLSVVYEDADIIVVDKQCGLVVHPAPGNWTGTLVHALLYHSHDLGSIAGSIRPGIVHRLDKDTTGLMVVAKNERAMAELSLQIKERRVERSYLALVWGRMPAQEGRIEASIGRHPMDRKKMDVVSSGRPAATEYRVLWENGRYSLLALRLDTGRTHQIRVHCTHIGHPLVGDPMYGAQPNTLGLSTQALHAYCLCLSHPTSGEVLRFESEPHVPMRRALDKLGIEHPWR